MNTAILIPARAASTRFPDKPLALLNDVPMIRRVYDRCCMTGLDTFVLTDSKRIASLFPEGNVIVDDAPYDNGTERCCGAINNLPKEYDYIINVQGDMPDITQEIIDKIQFALQYDSMATVWTAFPDKNLTNDPNSVKLIHNYSYANWFGRGFAYGSWHLGVYGFKTSVLRLYNGLSVPPEEKIEKLEQLRWIQAGYRIALSKVSFNGMEINTPEDLAEWHSKNSQ
jgi:3-deoxy-manno-octulosonate cytidylyltransferase (CMP-KDO synthetase)